MPYIIKGAPFRYKGAINVEDCKTSKDVIEKAKLNWFVDKCELVAKVPNKINNTFSNGFTYEDVPNAYGIYRTDINKPLGIVKDRYEPVQNIEAFNFFDDAIGKNKAVWQTAGFFGNGERIFVSAKLPNTIFVQGDPVDSYLVFTTSHDGTGGVKILFTPIRIICENTLNAAIRKSTNCVTFKHTKSVKENLNIAAELLGICKHTADVTEDYYNQMYNIKCTDKEAESVFAKAILSNKELNAIKDTGHTVHQLFYRDYNAITDANISSKKVNTLCKINDYYYCGIGQKSIAGTGWGVYNAVTGYYSNVDNSEGLKRMDSLLYGDKSRKIEQLNNLILVA